MNLTAKQLFWTIITFEIGNTLLVTVSPTASFARQNMWISFLGGGVLGLLAILIAVKTSLLHPDRNFLGICRKILGKWAGTFVVILYLMFWLSTLGIILNDFADFLNTVMLPTTPPWIFDMTMLLLIIYAVYAGKMRGIGRASEFFGPIIVFSLCLVVLLLIPNFEIQRLLPVFADPGFGDIAAGSLFPFALMSEGVIFMAFVPFLDHPERATVWVFRGVAVTIVFVLIVVLSVIMTMGGELAGVLNNPTLIAISYINAMDFLQNLEIVGVLTWILSIFVKLTVYLFLTSYYLGELFKAADWKWISWPVALAAFVQTLLFAKFSINGQHVIMNFWLPFILPVYFVILPLLLWTVGTIRKRWQRA